MNIYIIYINKLYTYIFIQCHVQYQRAHVYIRKYTYQCLNLLSSFSMRIEVELAIMTLDSMVVNAMLKASVLSTMSSFLIVIRKSALVVPLVVACMVTVERLDS